MDNIQTNPYGNKSHYKCTSVNKGTSDALPSTAKLHTIHNAKGGTS